VRFGSKMNHRIGWAAESGLDEVERHINVGGAGDGSAAKPVRCRTVDSAQVLKIPRICQLIEIDELPGSPTARILVEEQSYEA